MKILFFYTYDFAEPVGIMALSAFLKHNGHQCDLIDVALERDYVKGIREIRPDIVAYSITTGKHAFYQRLNLELKKKMSFFSIFGGPHATFAPEFIEEEGVDAICRGEGEYPLLELADALGSGRDYTRIQNLWVKHDAAIYRNEVRPLLEDLDSLPFIDRELINKYNVYRRLHRRVVLTGRGCPYGCSYCFNHSFNGLYKGKGAVVRKRSVDHVMREVKEVHRKYQPKRFHFIDDTFILNEQWCVDFCTRYHDEMNAPFFAHVRANLVTDEVIKSMKRAGCQVVFFAIESGNEYIRNSILNRNMSEKEILDAARICKKHKLRMYLQNMIGIPDEALAMAFETIKLNIKCRPEYAWCSIYQPYPRTKLWRYCEEKGYISHKNFDESFHTKSILNIRHRMQFENLHHLFSIAVAFPFLVPAIRVLIKLPLGTLYHILWRLFRFWAGLFRTKLLDFSELFITE